MVHFSRRRPRGYKEESKEGAEEETSAENDSFKCLKRIFYFKRKSNLNPKWFVQQLSQL